MIMSPYLGHVTNVYGFNYNSKDLLTTKLDSVVYQHVMALASSFCLSQNLIVVIPLPPAR